MYDWKCSDCGSDVKAHQIIKSSVFRMYPRVFRVYRCPVCGKMTKERVR